MEFFYVSYLCIINLSFTFLHKYKYAYLELDVCFIKSTNKITYTCNMMAEVMLAYNHHKMVVVLSFVSGSLVHNLAV